LPVPVSNQTPVLAVWYIRSNIRAFSKAYVDTRRRGKVTLKQCPCVAVASPPINSSSGVALMLTRLFSRIACVGRRIAQVLGGRMAIATKPAGPVLVLGTLADLPRSKSALVAENALLRYQLLILQRSVKRPRCTPPDRALLVRLASRIRLWRQAVLIVQPETVLRWHRQGFRLFWRRKARPTAPPTPKVADETIVLIRELAAANHTWGAERIRGELLKLHIRVAKTADDGGMSSSSASPEGWTGPRATIAPRAATVARSTPRRLRPRACVRPTRRTTRITASASACMSPMFASTKRLLSDGRCVARRAEREDARARRAARREGRA